MKFSKLLIIVLSLGICGFANDTPGKKLDEAIDKTEKKAEDLREEAEDLAESGKEKLDESREELGEKIKPNKK